MDFFSDVSPFITTSIACQIEKLSTKDVKMQKCKNVKRCKNTSEQDDFLMEQEIANKFQQQNTLNLSCL